MSDAVVQKVQKRDGTSVGYDRNKITVAVTKACASVGIYDPELPEKLTSRVEEMIRDRYEGSSPSVEDIQNLVETTLIRSGYQEVARSYMLYRQKRQEVRDVVDYAE